MRRLVSNVVRFFAAAVLLGLGHGAAPSWAAETRVGLPVELTGRPVLGVNTAPVLVVEISNFKCVQ